MFHISVSFSGNFLRYGSLVITVTDYNFGCAAVEKKPNCSTECSKAVQNNPDSN